MNIYVVSNHGKLFHIRPDSSLVKGSSIFYIPDFIQSMTVSPGVSFFLEKSAKCVSRSFFERYIKYYSYGMLLYAKLPDKGFLSDNSSLFSSIFDKSSYLSADKMNIDAGIEGNLTVTTNEKEYEISLDSVNMLEIAKNSLEKISSVCTLKSGDIIFIESGMVEAEPGTSQLLLAHNKNHILRLNIK